jgi:hypothetical protein
MSEKISVLQLCISPYQHDKHWVNEIALDDDGIIGDYHRQKDALITLLPLETWLEVSNDSDALCTHRFYAHILSSEYANDAFPMNTCLKSKNALFQVVSVGKSCHKEDGCQYHGEEGCPLMRKTRFLRILFDGTLSVNDNLEVAVCSNTP